MSVPVPEMPGFAETREAVEREPLPRNVGAVLDQAVARFADRPYWISVDDGAQFTYRQFGDAVERCRAALAGFGVSFGTHVAVMLPNVPVFAITWLALAKLGAVMVPVNTRFTAAELDYVLSGSDASILVIDAEYVPTLREIGADRLSVTAERTIVCGAQVAGYPHPWQGLVAGAAAGVPVREPEPDDLLTLQFTSGSTGFPKGCMLSHLYWTMIGKVRSRQGPPVERILLDLPIYYMGGQWRLLMGLYLGATVFVARQPTTSRFVDRLLQFGIDFCSVSNTLAKLPDDPRYLQTGLKWGSSMALAKELHADFEHRLQAPILELYGMTEIGSTMSVPAETRHMVGSGSCGLPVAFRDCKIVAPGGVEVAPGQSGELWVSGPGLMLGYYKRSDVYAEIMQGKWLRTGDLFRKDSEGFHYIVGRIKDVIRRSGENIASVEIESALCQMPEIAEAAALAVPDVKRGEEVKVCIVLNPGWTRDDVPPECILAFCANHLARFKQPRYFAYVADIPKTAKGSMAKHELQVKGRDPREGAFDALDGVWR